MNLFALIASVIFVELKIRKSFHETSISCVPTEGSAVWEACSSCYAFSSVLHRGLDTERADTRPSTCWPLGVAASSNSIVKPLLRNSDGYLTIKSLKAATPGAQEVSAPMSGIYLSDSCFDLQGCEERSSEETKNWSQSVSRWLF